MFLELLAIPIVRRLAGALLIVAALTAIVYSIYHAGAHAGAAAEASHQIAANQSVFERIETSTRQRLDSAAAHERELAALVERLAAQATAASSRAAAAETTAASDRSRIAALSDAAVKSDLQRQLGLPQKSDSSLTVSPDSSRNESPGASLDAALKDPATLRQLDARLAGCAHLAEKTAALEQQVTALAAGSAARDSQLTAVATERDAALDAYNQLVPLYTQAFNAATQRHRRWFCLFLCRTGPHLSLPAPLPSRSTQPKHAPPPRRSPRISPRCSATRMVEIGNVMVLGAAPPAIRSHATPSRHSSRRTRLPRLQRTSPTAPLRSRSSPRASTAVRGPAP